MAADVAQEALRLFRARFREQGSRARAATEKTYLKSDLRFYGTGVPAVRAAAREFARAHPDLSATELRRVCDALWTDEHEMRSAAIALCERYRARLSERDLGWLIGLVGSSDTWAHVDWIATKTLGDVLTRTPSAARVLATWARDECFWVRRTALLAQHDELRAGRGDFALFARLAAAMLDEREFFIRKAIGWILREVSKTRPELTFEFLHANRARVSRLTLQEGAKYLQRPQRLALGLPAEAAWIAREHRRKTAAASR